MVFYGSREYLFVIIGRKVKYVNVIVRKRKIEVKVLKDIFI